MVIILVVSVCLSVWLFVCLSVCRTITFESLDIRSLFHSSGKSSGYIGQVCIWRSSGQGHIHTSKQTWNVIPPPWRLSASMTTTAKTVNALHHWGAMSKHDDWKFLASYRFHFYSASALLAMQSAVLARGILSVHPSFCLSIRPSVCSSRSGIVSRRKKIRLCSFQHLVGQSL